MIFIFAQPIRQYFYVNKQVYFWKLKIQVSYLLKKNSFFHTYSYYALQK